MDRINNKIIIIIYYKNSLYTSSSSHSLCGVINKVSNSFPHVTSLRTLTCISVRLHQALRMSKEGDVSPFY